ncbi:MAG: hypothetical protein ACE5OQ_02800 [Woeseia sp.]
MNQDRDNNVVSAKYRATATERVPPEIDAKILEQAIKAVRHSGLQGFTAYWFRPLAFVATLLLSLALVLELTRPPETPPAADFGIGAGPSTPAADDAGRIESFPRENVPAHDNGATGDFGRMIENSAKRMREMDPVTQHAISELRQSRQTDKQPEAVAAFGTSDVQERYCTEEQSSDALKWWRCISDLREAGKHDQARAELTLFDAAHPDFEPPGAR